MKFNSLVPELYVSDYAKSLHFYTKVLGFTVEYERSDPLFAFLSYLGSQLMIQQREFSDEHTGLLEKPYGRGINFEIKTPDLDVIINALKSNDYPLRKEAAEYKRKTAKGVMRRSREIQVLDPDGYFLRFSQSLNDK